VPIRQKTILTFWAVTNCGFNIYRSFSVFFMLRVVLRAICVLPTVNQTFSSKKKKKKILNFRLKNIRRINVNTTCVQTKRRVPKWSNTVPRGSLPNSCRCHKLQKMPFQIRVVQHSKRSAAIGSLTVSISNGTIRLNPNKPETQVPKRIFRILSNRST